MSKVSTKAILYYITAFIVGGVISIMVVFNTNLGLRTNNSVSIAINQIVGIVLLTAIMLSFRGNAVVNPPREKANWYQWFGGLFGLVVISCNYLSVSHTGASIAMAAAVLGQCLMGTIYDITGFMHMERRALTKRKVASLLVSLFGIAIMLFWPSEESFSSSSLLYVALAILAGVVTMIQMVYNSSFAGKKGAFFSARQNVISGLIGITLFALLLDLSPSLEAIKRLDGYPFISIIMGGTLACVVVVATNIVIPKIPGSASSILLSAGQILTAVLLDYLFYDIAEPSLIVGSVIMVLGLAISP